MATLESIIDALWDASNVAKPTIVSAPEYGEYLYSRLLHIKHVQKVEEYMDIFRGGYYSANSHDAYRCSAGSTTLTDVIAIVDEVRRICSQYTPSGSDKILAWEGGDLEYETTYWFRLYFVVFKRKSGADLIGM